MKYYNEFENEVMRQFDQVLAKIYDENPTIKYSEIVHHPYWVGAEEWFGVEVEVSEVSTWAYLTLK